MISWLIRIVKGIVIALGFILPGVSGGVLATILGIYERMIYFLAHIKEKCTLFFTCWYWNGFRDCTIFPAS